MKALTLWQPWAQLIVDGRKTIETRSRPMLSHYRGPLAIHAAMKFDSTVLKAAKDFGYNAFRLPLGAVLGIVKVVDVQRFPHAGFPPDEYGDFTAGRYGILMELITKFKHPVSARGFQGIWNWNSALNIKGQDRDLLHSSL